MQDRAIDALITVDRILIFSSSGKKVFSKGEVIHTLSDRIARDWVGVDAAQVADLVFQREADLPTRLGPLLAVPHAVLPGMSDSRLAAAVVPRGVEWDSDRENPVQLVMLLAGDQEHHLKILSDLALTLRDEHLLNRLIKAEDPGDFLSVFTRERMAVPGPRYLRGRDISAMIFEEAIRLRDSLGEAKLVLHADALADARYIRELVAGRDALIVTGRGGVWTGGEAGDQAPVVLPFKGDRHHADIKFSLLYLLSLGLLGQDDIIVNVYGKPDSGYLDSVRLISMGEELDLRASRGEFEGFPEDVDLSIFNRVLHIALELAAEGREGKPVGTIFVVGGRDGVSPHITQMIANPFHGYPPEDRNILDPGMEETIKEYAKIDGAFIISGDGTIEAAGAYLSGRPVIEEMTSGLGARHAAAQGITAVSSAMAVAISESTRKVTVFRGGRRVMEL